MLVPQGFFPTWCVPQELYEKASQEVTGPLSSAHQWVNMSDVSVELNATHTVRAGGSALIPQQPCHAQGNWVSSHFPFLPHFWSRLKPVSQPWGTALLRGPLMERGLSTSPKVMWGQISTWLCMNRAGTGRPPDRLEPLESLHSFQRDGF